LAGLTGFGSGNPAFFYTNGIEQQFIPDKEFLDILNAVLYKKNHHTNDAAKNSCVYLWKCSVCEGKYKCSFDA